MKINRLENKDDSPLNLNKARNVGKYFFSQIRQHDPSVRLISADVVRNFNGHEAVLTVYKLANSEYISYTVVSYKKNCYVIGFEGPEDEFRSYIGSSVFSFKIL